MSAMTADELLCSPKWKLKQSLWMVPAILGVGLATWMGFAYIGARGKQRRWVIYAVGYFLAGCALMWLASAFPTGDKEHPIEANLWVGWVVIAFWAAGLLHAILTHKRWLRVRAEQVAAATGSRIARRTNLPHVPPVPMPATPSGLAEGAGERSSADINAATVEGLVGAGLTNEEAQAVIEARTANGSFTRVTEVISRAGIQPHRYAEVAGSLRAEPRADSHPSTGSPGPTAGRRLDL